MTKRNKAKHFHIFIPKNKEIFQKITENHPDVARLDDPKLTQRFPAQLLEQRLKKQQHHAALNFRDGIKFYWENFDAMVFILERSLKAMNLLKTGLQNALDYQITHHTFYLKKLPPAFDHYKILHLSDLHIEGLLDHGESLSKKLNNIEYDCCVVTGDFRYLTYGQYDDALAYTKRLIKQLPDNKPIYGILGNHDYIEMVPALESIGIQMLVNESCRLEFKNQSIGLAGVDDPHFYQTDETATAYHNIDREPVKILLAHSQEPLYEAASYGFDIMLSGHTHGGQICLPGGRPIIYNTPLKECAAGRWNYNHLQGYTSRGQGTSGLAVRFNCPPEITIHTLRIP